MNIKHLKHHEINFSLWDQKINESQNKLIYAFSWYLNIVCPNWEALVSENYDYIMPLPTKNKFGLKYLVQPKQTQQLGVFSQFKIDEKIVSEFIQKIPYLSYELHLNELNYSSKLNKAPNFVLNLNKKYEELKKCYSKNTIRNIEKSKRGVKLHINEINVDEYFKLYLSVFKLHNADIELLSTLINESLKCPNNKLLGVTDEFGNLIAAFCMAVTDCRITYLLPVSNEEGKKQSAMFLLIDHIIEKYSESNLEIDFEGSKIESIARFYKGFGATTRPYFIIRRFRPQTLITKLLTKNL